MKFATAVLIGAVAANNKDTKLDVAKFTEGFLKGSIDATGFEDIQKCIQDGEHVVQDAEKIYQDVKSKDITHIVDAFKVTADAINTIKTAMVDCKSSVKADWDRLEKMAKTISSPTSFAWHVGKDIVANGVKVTHEVDNSMNAYEKKDWYNFGYNLGEMTEQVFLGPMSVNYVDTKADVIQFTEGFLFGALEAEGFDDIENCIKDGEAIVKDAEAAYSDFKKKDVADVIKGFKDVADAMKYVKSAMTDCKNIKADWEKFAEMMEAFSSPQSFAWHVGKDIIANGKDITLEIAGSIEDYEKSPRDWNGFGKNLGMATAKVFVGQSE